MKVELGENENLLDMLMERENYCEDGFIAVRPQFSQSVDYAERIYNSK